MAVEYQREIGGYLADKAREISRKTGVDVNRVLIELIRLHNEVLEGIFR